MINTTEDNRSNEKNEQRRRRVNTIKAVIIAFVFIFMILPPVCCVYLGVRLVRLQKQVNRLVLLYLPDGALYDNSSENIAYAAEKQTDMPDKADSVIASDRQSQVPESTVSDSRDLLQETPAVADEFFLTQETADTTADETDADTKVVSIDSLDSHIILPEDAGYYNTEDTVVNDGVTIPEHEVSPMPDDRQTDVQAEIKTETANKAENSADNVTEDNRVDSTTGTAEMEPDKEGELSSSSRQGRFAGKKVYLTFDDGPSIYTDDILDILKEYGVKATFFVVGKTDSFSKAMYKRIVDEGHTLGMHSYSHKYDIIYNSVEDFDKDFTKLWNLLYDTTGLEPKIYRFPGGSANKVNKKGMDEFIKYLNEKSIVYYDWNVLNGDATNIKYTDEQLINNVLKGVEAKKTSIVLLHDAASKEATVRTLPALLEELLVEGAELYPLDPSVKPIQMIKADSVK